MQMNFNVLKDKENTIISVPISIIFLCFVPFPVLHLSTNILFYPIQESKEINPPPA